MKAVKVSNIGTDHDGFHPTKVTAGSPDVFIDGVPAARVGDPLEPHDKPNNPKHGRTIATGSSTVFINGKPASLTGGKISCGGVTIGNGTVNIGDQPPASSSPAPASAELYSNEEATTEPIPETLQKMVKKIVNTTVGTGIFTPMEVLVPASESEIADQLLSEENFFETAAGGTYGCQFIIKNRDNEPIPSCHYKLRVASGEPLEGKTTENGETLLMYSQEESEEVTIYLKKFVTEIPEIDGSTALSAEFLWFEAGSADTVPIASQTPHEIVDTRFRVTDIPTVMKDTLNWPKSAELMELWFSLDAREMTKREKEGKTKTSDYPKENTNTTMFTWVWMKQFEQVTPAVKELLTKLQTQNAIKAIRSNLANHLKGHPTVERPIKINNPLNPVFLHSNWQFQYINVGYDIGKVDDLYGSLGNFALYAAITKCTVKRKIITNEQLIHINEIGIYMKDTYDFLGNQYLGNWGYGSFAISPSSGMLNSLEIESHDGAVAFEDGEYLTAFGNEDYRRHRERTSRGGDLLLFSDVKTFPVDIFLSLEQ